MRKPRAALFAAFLLPLTGCVFAVGVDDDKNEALRDRVRDLERRMDRMDRPHGGQPMVVQPGTIVIQGESVETQKQPLVPTIIKDEK